MLDLTGTFNAGPTFQVGNALYTGGGLPFKVPGTNITGAAMGYYNNGFVGAGGNQTGISLGSVLGGIATGLENIFHFPTGGSVGTSLPAPVPTIEPPATNQHPILTGAGGASGKGSVAGKVAAGTAVVGGVAGLVAPHLVGLGGGGRARYAPAGTKGYHMIKRGPHAGMWTRNRHRNVANIRALRRSISRLHGFERICRKVVHFVKPHTKGRPVFRRRRRSK